MMASAEPGSGRFGFSTMNKEANGESEPKCQLAWAKA